MKELIFACFVFMMVLLVFPPALAQNHEESWKIVISNSEEFFPLDMPVTMGETVEWHNNDSVTHTVTSGLPEYPEYAGEFFNDVIESGEAFEFTFDNPDFDSFYYFCEIHPWMAGRIFYDAFEDKESFSLIHDKKSYKIGEKIHFSGITENDYATTDYTVLVFDDKKNLIYSYHDKISENSEFSFSLDSSKNIWLANEKYTIKIIYGVPIKSGETTITIVNSEIVIPDWIRNNAKWWSEDQIDDQTFVLGIQFLIQNNIIVVLPTEQGASTGSNEIPSWIKNNAAWWAERQIDDQTFVSGIQFLVSKNIIML